MRAFIRLRQMMESNEELNRKFAAVIRKLSTHDKYFKVVFDELRKLAEQPVPLRKAIGFKTSNKSSSAGECVLARTFEVTICDLKREKCKRPPKSGDLEVTICDLKIKSR